MYELIQAGPNSYYINCPAKIGLYVDGDSQVWLIDSGNDKDAGRKTLRILEQQGWKLKAILNTHSNADHIGGNRYLQNQTGCAIYAPGIEADFTRHPLLEPSFLYGGYPCKDLRHKFLLAQDSRVSDLSEAALPEGFEVIPLPGHFFDMVGFRTPDGTVFLADCVTSRETLDKYAIFFLYDAAAFLDTLDRISALEAPLFVPAHAEATSDIRPLADYNRKKVQEVAAEILRCCETPAIFEHILQHLFQHYGLTMTFEQHALVGSTVRSYLSWLKDTGRLETEFQDSLLLWHTAEHQTA